MWRIVFRWLPGSYIFTAPHEKLVFNKDERSDPLKCYQTIFCLVFNDPELYDDAAEYSIKDDFENLLKQQKEFIAQKGGFIKEKLVENASEV